MVKSKTVQFKVSQTLHGYRDGHKLLAGSIPVDEYAEIEMARMSDLMPQHLADDSYYLCGYPLKSINKYVLAKTWAASEMPRPGCVWTHSILLDYSAVAKIQNLFPLLGLFNRPNFGEDFDYLEDLTFDCDFTGALEKENGLRISDAETINVSKALSGIYFGSENKVFVSSNFNQDVNNFTPIFVWNQMPPRLRRDFVFCTSGGLRSFTPSAEITLIITEEFLSFPSFAPVESLGFDLLLQDVFSLKQSELRAFISRYDVDAKDARGAVPKLAEIADRLFIDDIRRGLERSSELIVEYFPRSGDCRLLKREFLSGAIIDGRKIDENERFNAVLEYVLPSLKFLENFQDSDAVKKFINGVATLFVDLPKLIKACVGSIKGSLGHCLLKTLCEFFPLESIASVRLDAELKLTLASLNPNLLHQPSFWATFDSQLNSDDLDALNSVGELDVLAEGFLAGRMYAPFRGLMRENPQRLLPHLIGFIEKQDHSLCQFLVSEYRDERVSMIEYLVNSGECGISILETIADDIFYSTYPEVPASLWVELFSKNKLALNFLTPTLAFVIFEQAGWLSKRELAFALYKLAFPVLHDLPNISRMGAQAVIDKIRHTYPPDYSSYDLDIGSRIRRKLCDFFVGSNQYNEFIGCAHNDETLAKLFVSTSALWSGKEWLQRLLDAVESGQVLMTINQKNMLLNVIPKRRKGLFGFF